MHLSVIHLSVICVSKRLDKGISILLVVCDILPELRHYCANESLGFAAGLWVISNVCKIFDSKIGA